MSVACCIRKEYQVFFYRHVTTIAAQVIEQRVPLPVCIFVYITDIAQKNVNKTIIWRREYKSRRYFIPSATVNNNSGVDWITASTLCRSTVSGANLVSMITDTLQIYLQSNLPTAYHYWTNGISDVSYRWPSGMYQLPQLNEWFVLP